MEVMWGVLGGQHVETSEMKGASRARARVHLRMAWMWGQVSDRRKVNEGRWTDRQDGAAPSTLLLGSTFFSQVKQDDCGDSSVGKKLCKWEDLPQDPLS